jgi:hypothetical protein
MVVVLLSAWRKHTPSTAPTALAFADVTTTLLVRGVQVTHALGATKGGVKMAFENMATSTTVAL